MIRHLILPLAAIMLLSACAGKYGIQKRRYNKGFYVSHTSKNNVAGKEQCRQNPGTPYAEALPVLQTSLKPSEESQPELMTRAEAYRSAIVLPSSNLRSIPVQNQIQVTADRAMAAATVKSFFQKPSFKTIHTQPKKQKGDDMKIVMIILCLFPFINLIPVYMHDDGVTLNFWITLILDIFIFLGIIFALLVVLDIVDLR